MHRRPTATLRRSRSNRRSRALPRPQRCPSFPLQRQRRPPPPPGMCSQVTRRINPSAKGRRGLRPAGLRQRFPRQPHCRPSRYRTHQPPRRRLRGPRASPQGKSRSSWPAATPSFRPVTSLPHGYFTSGPPMPATGRRRYGWEQPSILPFSAEPACARSANQLKRNPGTGMPLTSARPRPIVRSRAQIRNSHRKTMKRPTIAAAIFATLIGLATPVSAAAPLDVAVVNRGVVELQTGRAAGISVRIAEDLANLIDDGATRRVLPVIGKGSLQNITDLKLLRGIDMAILQADVLDYARRQDYLPGLEGWITYIAKLYNEEFHLLARRDIKSVAELANRPVNVDLRGAGTSITAGRLFALLNIPVTPTYDDHEVALEKLRKGDIAALAFVAGKPAPLFRSIAGEDGLHFLAIPLRPEVTAAYVPTRLTAQDYPGLVPGDQPVDTVAVGAVLAAANLQFGSDRYRNLVNFVEAFFTGFQSLLEPGHHPKWREVNITAELPGWRRFPPADQWLQRNVQAAAPPNLQDLKAIFSRFIEERQQAAGGQPMTQQEKDQLFGQFELWQKNQIR